jgi:uncharacterized protein (DUF736 family)
MAFEQRDGSGALFKNERKQSDRHPDYTGSAMINGVDVGVSAWVKKSSSGKSFFSLAFNPKQEQQHVSNQQYGNAPADDDLPF